MSNVLAALRLAEAVRYGKADPIQAQTPAGDPKASQRSFRICEGRVANPALTASVSKKQDIFLFSELRKRESWGVIVRFKSREATPSLTFFPRW